MPSRDYEEFLESFNAKCVRYLVIGAHAVAALTPAYISIRSRQAQKA